MEQQMLDFIRLRINQLNVDLQVYKDLGPSYADEEKKLVAVLGELENLTVAFETFMLVGKSAKEK